jgi:hypothetical protein
MVFFALTRSGYDQLVASMGSVPSPMWVNFGVLSQSEIADIRKSGTDITAFSFNVAADPAKLDNALDTIGQHHPGSALWVEHPA